MIAICSRCSSTVVTPTSTDPCVVICANCGLYLQGLLALHSSSVTADSVAQLPDLLPPVACDPEEILVPAHLAFDAITALASKGRVVARLEFFVGSLDRFRSSPDFPHSDVRPPHSTAPSQRAALAAERSQELLHRHLSRFRASEGSDSLLISIILDDTV